MISHSQNEFTKNELLEMLGHYKAYSKDIAEGWELSTNQHYTLVNSIINKLESKLKD